MANTEPLGPCLEEEPQWPNDPRASALQDVGKGVCWLKVVVRHAQSSVTQLGSHNFKP